MRPLCHYIRLQGLGIEKQLTRLEQMGYKLYDVRRVDLRTVELGFAVSEGEAILSFLQARGFSCTALPPRGAVQTLHQFKTRTPFVIFLLCALLLLSLSMRCIWRIEITGAGAYIGEVRSFLKEENLSIGRDKQAIDLKAIESRLTHRLPRVAWVHASLHGLTLRIDVIQGVPMPDIESCLGNGSIIAAQDGVIEAISVFAGTAAVQPGDSVKAGDVLIYGYERGANDTLLPVRARGRITAHTYISATAAVSAQQLSIHRTGNSQIQYLAHLPMLELPLTPSPSYLTEEFESSYLPVGGAWIPLQVEKRTVFELYLQQEAPDEAAIKAEATRLSLQNLLLKCSKNDEIIDKWLYYSMIEGGILSATVTAQVLTEIGLFSPETPE
ncbi:MAG: sporulation protein YqfD [Clostridia bacterium]|nr:sporulation protein YqfD [Clostridia bacterium]